MQWHDLNWYIWQNFNRVQNALKLCEVSNVNWPVRPLIMMLHYLHINITTFNQLTLIELWIRYIRKFKRLMKTFSLLKESMLKRDIKSDWFSQSLCVIVIYFCNLYFLFIYSKNCLSSYFALLGILSVRNMSDVFNLEVSF